MCSSRRVSTIRRWEGVFVFKHSLALLSHIQRQLRAHRIVATRTYLRKSSHRILDVAMSKFHGGCKLECGVVLLERPSQTNQHTSRRLSAATPPPQALTWASTAPPPLRDLQHHLNPPVELPTSLSSLKIPHSAPRAEISESFDWSKSTSANYCSPEKHFFGPFAAIRASLDYEYHNNYVRSRSSVFLSRLLSRSLA